MTASQGVDTQTADHDPRKVELCQVMRRAKTLECAWHTIADFLRETYGILRTTYVAFLESSKDPASSIVACTIVNEQPEDFTDTYLSKCLLRFSPSVTRLLTQDDNEPSLMRGPDDLGWKAGTTVPEDQKRLIEARFQVVAEMIGPYGTFLLRKPPTGRYRGVVGCEFDARGKGRETNPGDVARAAERFEAGKETLQAIFEALHACVNDLGEEAFLSAQVVVHGSPSPRNLYMGRVDNPPLLGQSRDAAESLDPDLLDVLTRLAGKDAALRPGRAGSAQRTVEEEFAALLAYLREFGIERINYGVRYRPWEADNETSGWLLYGNYHDEVVQWYKNTNQIEIDRTVQESRKSGDVLSFTFWKDISRNGWSHGLTNQKIDFEKVCWRYGYRKGVTFVFSARDEGTFFQVAFGCKVSNSTSREKATALILKHHLNIAASLFVFHILVSVVDNFSIKCNAPSYNVQNVSLFNSILMDHLKDSYGEEFVEACVDFLLFRGLTKTQIDALAAVRTQIVDALGKEAVSIIGHDVEKLRVKMGVQIEPDVVSCERAEKDGGEVPSENDDDDQKELPGFLPDIAPVLYKNRNKKDDRTIVDFLRSVWKPWIQTGILTRKDLRRLDPSAYKAVENWISKGRTLPDDVYLPTITEINDKILAENPVFALVDKRMSQVVTSRLRKRG